MDPERWQQIETLYHSALEQEPLQRSAFLAKSCGEDDELRREVDSLLLQTGSTSALVDGSGWKMAADLADTATHLTPGAKLGPYRILELLGRGGMGEVYRAIDTRLNRAVAIKISAEQFSARFEREARAISVLNHAHICTLYDVGPNYLVMEMVKGQTLASHLKKGSLAMERVLRYGTQIADALAAAHAHGVVHRDLKPSNIIITPAGVKVLDFGTAKLTSSGGSQPDATLTASGVIVGTPAYMAPEQLEAKECDARSDIFALGLVLYEMATGKRAFTADSQAALIAEILRAEPSAIDTLPPQFARVVRRCLVKEPERRWQSASDVKLELEEMALESAAISAPHPLSIHVPRLSAPRIAGLIFLFAAVAGVTWLLVRLSPTPAPPTFIQLTDQPGPEVYPSLSPDGKSFIYQSRSAGHWDIYLQRVGGKNPVNLTKGSNVDNTQPAFSPDGQRIAFRSERDDGGIFLMGATGEDIKRLTDFGYNPAWSPDGKELVCTTAWFFYPDSRLSNVRSQIFRIKVSTGEKQLVRTNRPDAVQAQWSPHGERLAFWGLRDGYRDIWTVSASGGQAVSVTDDAAIDWNPVWSPDGKYLYFSSDRAGTMNLWRVPINETSGKVLGPLEPVTTPSLDSGFLSFSPDGKRVLYVQQTTTWTLFKVAFDPTREATIGQPLPIQQGAVRFDASPDGRWVVFHSVHGKQEDLFVIGSDGKGLRQLTDDIYKDRHPRWSPDGNTIAFHSNRGGPYQIWAIHPDGSGLAQLTYEARPNVSNPVWSPDGSRLAYSVKDVNSFIIDVAKPWPAQSPQALPRLSGLDAYFLVNSWAPDGRQLAGDVQLLSGAAGIAVYSFERHEFKRLTQMGRSPRYLSDSRRLLFLQSDKLYLIDSQSNRVHEVLSMATHDAVSAVPSRDDRSIYISMRATEANIWQMNLRETN